MNNIRYEILLQSNSSDAVNLKSRFILWFYK